VVVTNTVAVTGSLALAANPLPTVTQDDDKQYDDDGIPYVNPNVPGADIALGANQLQEIALLTQLAAKTGLPVTIANPVPLQSAVGLNYLAASATNFATTPNAAANQVTSDIDIIAYAVAANWATGANQSLVGKFVATTNQRSYALQIGANGALRLPLSANGSTVVVGGVSTASVPFQNGAGGWIRATAQVQDGFGNIVYAFYTSSQPPYTPANAINWVPLGQVVTVLGGAMSIFAGTADIAIGMRTAATLTEPFLGNIYSVSVFAGINGQLALSFNASDASAGSNVSWTSSRTGEAWSGPTVIAGTAVKAAPGVIGSVTISGAPAADPLLLDTLQAILQELRVISMVITQLGQPVQDGPEQLRKDKMLDS